MKYQILTDYTSLFAEVELSEKISEEMKLKIIGDKENNIIKRYQPNFKKSYNNNIDNYIYEYEYESRKGCSPTDVWPKFERYKNEEFCEPECSYDEDQLEDNYDKECSPNKIHSKKLFDEAKMEYY